jgi:hypothetical protein
VRGETSRPTVNMATVSTFERSLETAVSTAC